jgi:hypothetical protein
MFSLFPKTKAVNAFAKELVASLAKRYPPALDLSAEKKISANRLTKVLEDALGKAADFQRENKLGVFGKAKLGNEFRWQLKELGYTEKFVEMATEGLMIYITRGSTPNAPKADKKANL